MTTFSKLTNRTTSYEQYDLLSKINIPLSGVVASTPIDGTTLTGNEIIVLSRQSTSTENGIYKCTITGANYDLTLLNSLTPATTFNGGAPLIFNIISGVSNNGIYQFSTNGTVAKFTKLVTNILVNETFTSSPITLISGQTIAVPIVYTYAYNSIYSISTYAVSPSGQVLILSLDGVTGDSLTGQTRQIVNLSNVTADNFTLIVKVLGI